MESVIEDFHSLISCNMQERRHPIANFPRVWSGHHVCTARNPFPLASLQSVFAIITGLGLYLTTASLLAGATVTVLGITLGLSLFSYWVLYNPIEEVAIPFIADKLNCHDDFSNLPVIPYQLCEKAIIIDTKHIRAPAMFGAGDHPFVVWMPGKEVNRVVVCTFGNKPSDYYRKVYLREGEELHPLPTRHFEDVLRPHLDD